METLLMTSAKPEVLTEKPRIATIDLMRGFVMVIMALDHARDFYHTDAFVYDPTDLGRTTPILFFTRFITHFCAPTFVLLAGTAVRISEQRKSKRELSMFLLTRGLWLVLLEVTVVRFGILFQLHYDLIIFQVIWAIGISMVVMSAVVRLPFKAILAIGLIIVFGHDLLHGIRLEPGDRVLVVWTFIHQVNFVEIFPGVSAFVNYPFLPWFGILVMGYCLGELFGKRFDGSWRRQLLLNVGLACLLLFAVLRYFNLYGDPFPWSQQKNGLYTFMSFLNVTKYPPSLHYTLLMTGTVLMIMSWLEKGRMVLSRPLVVFGRVPLFYYVLHFYLLHLGALILYMISSGKTLGEIDFHFNAGFGGLPRGYGYPLIAGYIAWIAVVLILYPACKWYDEYKTTHNRWWLRYL